MKKEKELESGWVMDAYNGGVYHFEHIPIEVASDLWEGVEFPWCVESVNGTFGNGDKSRCI